MAPTTSIPRFLLPQRGLIWGKAALRCQTIRHASGRVKPAKKASKPIVLEKPTKFNPPSHPSRRYKEPRQYPGPNLSEEEAARMKTKKYPSMLPPEGSFMRWFLTNKSVHIYISLVCPAPSLMNMVDPFANSIKGHTYNTRLYSLDDKLQTQFPLQPHAAPGHPVPAPPYRLHADVHGGAETHHGI